MRRRLRRAPTVVSAKTFFMSFFLALRLLLGHAAVRKASAAVPVLYGRSFGASFLRTFFVSSAKSSSALGVMGIASGAPKRLTASTFAAGGAIVRIRRCLAFPCGSAWLCRPPSSWGVCLPAWPN